MRPSKTLRLEKCRCSSDNIASAPKSWLFTGINPGAGSFMYPPDQSSLSKTLVVFLIHPWSRPHGRGKTCKCSYAISKSALSFPGLPFRHRRNLGAFRSPKWMVLISHPRFAGPLSSNEIQLYRSSFLTVQLFRLSAVVLSSSRNKLKLDLRAMAGFR